MADRLTARLALDMSQMWLERMMEDETPDDWVALRAQVAMAYATFAQAAAVVDGTIDVRARVESGI